ncbi:MAG: prenyltransferase/squalene oxidase repeat-containing protein [Verrucomicrobiota bacterium]
MIALFAARNAGIAVPEEAIKKGIRFYEACRSPGGGFGYSSAGAPNLPRTAVGTLVYALAREPETPEFKKTLDYLTVDLDHRDQSYPFYYEYYMAQALYQAVPEIWKEWDRRNVTYLESTQQPEGNWRSNHGNTFSTAGALLSLALNYRLLPIYER